MYKVDLIKLKESKTITCLECCFALNMLIEKIDIELLYCKSLYLFKKILIELLESKSSYISYDGIARLHYIGRDLNLINWNIYYGNFNDMESIWSKTTLPLVVKIVPEKSELLLKMNKYFKNTKNHLVSILDVNRDYVVFFEPIVKQIIRMSKIDFKKCYDNTLYVFEKEENEGNLAELKYKSYKKFMDHINSLTISEHVDNGFILELCADLSNCSYIRDACSVFNVTCERILIFFSYVEEFVPFRQTQQLTQIIKECIKVSNKLRLLTEYCRTKNTMNPLIVELIEKMLNLDICILDEVILFRGENHVEYN